MTIQAFSEIIPDVRNEKNKIYQSNELVFISIVSVICGADTWNEIESFAKTHEDYFKKRLPGLLSVPSHDTLSRFSPFWILNGLRNVSGCGLATFAAASPAL